MYIWHVISRLHANFDQYCTLQLSIIVISYGNIGYAHGKLQFKPIVYRSFRYRPIVDG